MGKVIGWSVVIAMWTGCGVGLSWIKTQEQNKVEVISTAEIENTAYDMIEWISYDVENGKTDSIIADTYIDNLEQIIKEVR
tara:strand:- start:114 stop:356 length:243 start_codon:yes stop_codon:yes gene_type:complete